MSHLQHKPGAVERLIRACDGRRASQVCRRATRAEVVSDREPVPETSEVRLFIDRASLRVSAAAMVVIMTFYPVLSFAQSVPAGVTNIVPDGRTATTVSQRVIFAAASIRPSAKFSTFRNLIATSSGSTVRMTSSFARCCSRAPISG